MTQGKHVPSCDARMLAGENIILFDMDEEFCPIEPGDTISMDGFEIHIHSVEFTEDWGRFNWYCDVSCSRMDALMKFMIFEWDGHKMSVPKYKPTKVRI